MVEGRGVRREREAAVGGRGGNARGAAAATVADWRWRRWDGLGGRGASGGSSSCGGGAKGFEAIGCLTRCIIYVTVSGLWATVGLSV